MKEEEIGNRKIELKSDPTNAFEKEFDASKLLSAIESINENYNELIIFDKEKLNNFLL